MAVVRGPQRIGENSAASARSFFWSVASVSLGNESLGAGFAHHHGSLTELSVQSVNIMSKGKTGPAKGVPVSTALRNAIRDEGLTAYGAAKRAGVSVDAVQRFLNQQRGLTLATVDKLAAAMQLTLCPDD